MKKSPLTLFQSSHFIFERCIHQTQQHRCKNNEEQKMTKTPHIWENFSNFYCARQVPWSTYEVCKVLVRIGPFAITFILYHREIVQ